MFKTTITLAALLAAFSASASAEPPSMEPLRRAAAGEINVVMDGSLPRDGAVRNDAAVTGALRAVEPGPTSAAGRLVARPTMAPPAPARKEQGFLGGLVSNPMYTAGAGALIGAAIGFFVGGGMFGALAGAAIGALLGWGLSKLLGGKKG